MRLSNYISNLKWLVMSLSVLVDEVENWVEVLAYFISPVHRSALKIILRNRDTLTIPKDYIFEAIAETLLLNVYRFKMTSRQVVVDIGASVGDFALLASRDPDSRVYAFEPSPVAYSYMRENVASNRRTGVHIFNASANAHTLDLILKKYGEPRIDFLKVDCEGCEYNVLLKCPPANLGKVERIAMEIHPTLGRPVNDIVLALRREGFAVTRWTAIGHGQYLFAKRPMT